MAGWLDKFLREVLQEFWRTALYVAFWGVWTWIFGVLLAALVTAAHYSGTPVISYIFLGIFLAFVGLVVIGRIKGPPTFASIHSARSDALAAQPIATGPSLPLKEEKPRWAYDDYEPTPEDPGIVYKPDTERQLVTLRFLSDRANKNEDALFLLLYGYRLLLGMSEVPVSSLNRSLVESGCAKELNMLERFAFADARLDVDRLADSSVANRLLLKHGLSKGGFYRLTDTGLGKAKLTFIYMLDRA
jgi:hypothetical protein